MPSFVPSLGVCRLGEHNDFHKQTNFELATRVPLIIKVPGKPNSHGKHSTLFAELVDVYRTLAELAGASGAGAAAIEESVDGVSLAAAFDDPTIVTLAATGGRTDYTYAKTVSFSQYPGQHFGNCSSGYVFGGKCKEAPGSTISKGSATVAGQKEKKQQYMGYSVRSHTWRYTVWMPVTPNENDTSRPALITDWSATATSTPPRFTELYDHRGDNGTDYDWPGNNVNVAFDRANAAVISRMHDQALNFFKTQLPCAHPTHGAAPPPAPGPAQCVDGFQAYPNQLCKGNGGKTMERYSYYGQEALAACKAKCAALFRAGNGGCQCMDVGPIHNGGTEAGICRFSNASKKHKGSGEHIDAFIPCSA